MTDTNPKTEYVTLIGWNGYKVIKKGHHISNETKSAMMGGSGRLGVIDGNYGNIIGFRASDIPHVHKNPEDLNERDKKINELLEKARRNVALAQGMLTDDCGLSI